MLNPKKSMTKSLMTLAYLSFSFTGFAASAQSDQTIPVPVQIQESALTTITVQGVPGASQSDATVRVIKLTLDAKGQIKRGTGSTSPKYELGQQIKVNPDGGSYMVSYSGNSIVVQVAAGEHKTISLQKISVPRINGSYTFKIFPDLSTREQQLQRVLFTWLTPLPVTFNCYTYNDWGRITDTWTETRSTELLCAKSEELFSLGKKYCAAYNGSNYENLIGNLFRFNSDGSYQAIAITFTDNCGDDTYTENSESIKTLGREYIANGIDGDFVSMLPGTYGIEMKAPSGKTSSKLGVVLK